MEALEKLIKSFNVNNLPNENHLAYYLLISERAASDEAVSRRFEIFVQKFVEAVVKEDEAMRQLQSSSLTPEILELDNRRDQTYMAITRIVDAYQRYPQQQTQADAQKIEKYIKLNKVNISAQYDREYAQIMNLIQDLEAYCFEEVERLNLTAMLASLKQYNEELFNLIDQRDLLNSDRVKGLVRECRQKSDNVYHALVEVINAYIKINAGADLIPFVKGVNQTIDRLNLQVFKISSTGGSSTGDEVVEEEVVEEEVEEEVEETPDGSDNNTDDENENPGGTTTPPGSIPVNPQPGGGDPDDI